MSWRMVNIKHVTLNDITQLVKWHINVGTKIGLAQKRNEQTAVSKGVYQIAEIRVIFTVSQNSPAITIELYEPFT